MTTVSAPRHVRAPSQRATSGLAPALIFCAVLAAGIALRLWHLGTSPGWQWDEAVYLRVGESVQGGVLDAHRLYGIPWEPFLYQPPIYFVLLAHWFDAVGASMYHARLLGVGATAIMLILLFRLLWKLHGPWAALFIITPVVFDGWLLYIERASYIENMLMPIIVGAMLLYQRALGPAWYNFAVAGVALGVAASFKQTGVYALLAILLCWLILRRHHRGHLILLAVALAVIAIYGIAMVRMYDVPGHAWYVDQSLVQVRRVLGLQQSGGTLTSPAKLLHLLVSQYKYFIPSAIVALVALVVAVRRVWQCYRVRNWQPARDNALLFSWFVAGVVVFGASSLKFPQYFALILLPGYCYVWSELRSWRWPAAAITAAPVVAALAGVASLLLVLPAFQTNTLAEVQQYATRDIPPASIVVTEESIGDLIQQRWCTVEQATACLGHASYAITWKTYLQSSFTQGDPAFHVIMRGAVPIRSFAGPIGTATVWKLKGNE